MYHLGLSLLPLFLVFTSLSYVDGDCFEAAPNNNSYDNCATCYQTFSNAIVNTEDNKFRLSMAFFPINNAPSVQVQVTYQSGDPTTNTSSRFFWITGGFFIFQPLEVFLYRSLFFSPPTYLKESVTVILPETCFGNDVFFEYATQRLKGYAESQSATPAVDDSYLGVSVRETNAKIDFYLEYAGDRLIDAAYIVPSMIVFAGIVATLFIVWCCAPMQETVKTVKASDSLRANIIAAILLCAIISVFSAVLDIVSCVKDFSNDDLPSYYDRRMEFVIITIFLLIFYSLFLIFGIIFVCFELIAVIKYNQAHQDGQGPPVNQDGQGPPVNQDQGPQENQDQGPQENQDQGPQENQDQGPQENQDQGPQENQDQGPQENQALENFKAKCTSTLCQFNDGHTERIIIICVFLAGSAVLAFMAHFPSILMAWATNPFYASKVALFYGIIIFSYFTCFHYSFIVSSKAASAFKKAFGIKSKMYVLVPVSLFITFIAVTAVVCLITVFIVTVPVSNSIETATDGISSIYNGAVVLVGGLLAYKIGWHYVGHNFSASNALEKALKNLFPLPGTNKLPTDLEKCTEEGKLTEIMKAMIHDELTKRNLNEK